MSNNIFSVLIQMLSSVSVHGEADIKTMGNVFQILHGMEQAVTKPDSEEETDVAH